MEVSSFQGFLLLYQGAVEWQFSFPFDLIDFTTRINDFQKHEMKRINEYKKLFQIENEIELAALKLTYRKLVKQWHPDKFQDEDPLKEEALVMGRKVTDGYHFLVSIAPETKEANLPEYQKTIMECGIEDFKHKGLLLEITFTDGSSYEYFGVNANVYKKLINSDKQVRFAKRFIYESYLYRKSKKAAQTNEE